MAKKALEYWIKLGKNITLGKCLVGAVLLVTLGAYGCSGSGDMAESGKKKQKTVAQEAVVPPPAATSPAEVKPLSVPEVKKEQPVQPVDISLGVTINEFCQRFNKNSERVKSKLRIRKLQITAGATQNSFRHNFNENLYLTGKLNKNDNLVEEIVLVGVLNGSLATTVDLNVGIGTIITALDPELPLERKNAVLNALGINNDQADIYNLDKKVTRSGISYLTKSSRKAGLQFSVRKANAN